MSIAKMLPEGEIKPLVGHSKDMDTFGVYGHELSGEDTATAQKVTEIFERFAPRPETGESGADRDRRLLAEKLHSITDDQTAAEIFEIVDQLIRENTHENAR